MLLSKYLHQLKPNTGPHSFEQLLAALLSRLSGLQFRVCRSGSQFGHDGSASNENRGYVMFECKRYETSIPTSRELIAEMDQATGNYDRLDLWVVAASCNVGAQIIAEIEKKADREFIDFFVLDCTDHNDGPLDFLCAQDPDLVIKFLRGEQLPQLELDEAQSILTTIAADSNAERAVQNLKSRLTEPTIGWPAWRLQSHKKWLEIMRSPDSSRAELGQNIAVLANESKTVLRLSVEQNLDEWWLEWPAQRTLCCVLGDEGDGKTWSVARWLSKSISAPNGKFPPVIFIPSRDVTSNATITALVSQKVEGVLGEKGSQRRLSRWTKQQRPAVVVVLDGVGERETHELWRTLLEQSRSTTWSEGAAFICTARTKFWNEHFGSLPHLKSKKCIVSSFNDEERNQALMLRGLSLEEFGVTIHELLRKPRYLDLAVQHHKRLIDCGDATVARLIYEDWQDRYNNKSSTPISNDEFNDILKYLATAHTVGTTHWDISGLRRLSYNHSPDALFHELSTGGVFEHTPQGFRVEKQRLALGLGLLLCSELVVAWEESEDLGNTIADWLEPHIGIDLQAEILEQATLHSMKSECAIPIRVALLNEWLSVQNIPTHSEESVVLQFTAYLPENTEAYLELAERVWKRSDRNPWAEMILLRGFIRWTTDSTTFAKKLPSRFEKWVGMIPLVGPPVYRRRTDPEERNRLTEEWGKKLSSVLGADLASRPALLCSYPVSVIGDDGHLRLRLVAMAVISSLSDRNDFARVLAISLLCDALAEGTLNMRRLIEWIVRSARVKFANGLLKEANALLKSTDLFAKQAGARLLIAEGTHNGWRRWEQENSDEVFPPDEHWLKGKTQPFESIYKVTREELQEYARSPDFKPFFFVIKSLPHILDPSLSIDHELKICDLWKNINPRDFWSEENQGPANFLRQHSATFARYCSKDLCQLLRTGLGQERDAQEIGDIVYELDRYDLLLGQPEREALRRSWEDIHAELLQNEHTQYYEAKLLEAVLPLLSGREQLTKILSRGKNGFELSTYEFSFDGTEKIDSVEVKHEDEWYRALLFLIHTKQSRLTRSQLRECLAVDFGITRQLSNEYLRLCASDEDIEWWQSEYDWRWLPYMYEEGDSAAALLLQRCKSSDPDELIERIPPRRRGTFIINRTPSPEKYEQYAEWLDRRFQTMLNLAIPSDLPRFDILYDDSFPSAQHSISLAEPKRFLSYSQPELVWDRQNYGASVEPTEPSNLLGKINKRHHHVIRVCKDLAKQGHNWIGIQFCKDALPEAISVRPDLLDKWIQAINVQNLERAHSFYQCLCECLFEKSEHHKQARILYEALSSRKLNGSVIMPEFNIRRIDWALMNSPYSSELESLWKNCFEKCNTNLDLLELSIQLRSTRKHGALSWFKGMISEDLKSTVPFAQARAEALRGYLENDPHADWLSESIPADTYWLKRVQRAAQNSALTEHFCLHWFRSFCNETDTDIAWCHFTLFLACADRRCWLWIEDEISGTPLTTAKRRFFERNRSNIKRACEENEKDLQTTFLECDVNPNVYPWIKISNAN